MGNFPNAAVIQIMHGGSSAGATTMTKTTMSANGG